MDHPAGTPSSHGFLNYLCRHCGRARIPYWRWPAPPPCCDLRRRQRPRQAYRERGGRSPARGWRR